MSLTDANELKRMFPEETEGFDVFQVERIWQEYSDSLCASWIIPKREKVKMVFDSYR